MDAPERSNELTHSGVVRHMSALDRREFLAAAAALPLLARAQTVSSTVPAPAELSEVRKYIEEKVTHGIVPSVTVAMSRGGKLVWSESFGYADLESRRRAAPGTTYKLASLSKPLTAAALMTLVDRGLVELDRPANDYLAGAKLRAHAGSANDVTVRRLLDHTAGIPTHENLFCDNVPVLPRDETIRRHGFAAYAPGSRYHYTNLGNAILGFITEDVTRMPWERYLERALLQPLRMTRTGLERRADAAVQYDYDIGSRFVRTAEHRTDHPGASSLRSTTLDMLRFLETQLRGGAPVLSASSARLMQDGLGFQTDVIRGRRSFFHGGGGPGMGAWMRAFPEERIAFVVLTNYFGAMAEQVNKRICAALFPDAAESEALQPAATEQPELYAGTWRGTLEHHRGDLPLVLTIDGRKAEVKFGTTPWSQPLRELTFDKSEMIGTTEGILDVHAGYHGPSQFEFHLRREGNALRGVCHVYAKGYYELPHWVELTI